MSANFTWIVLWTATIFFVLSIFTFSDVYFPEDDAMKICRGMSLLSSLLMFYCSALLCYNIYKIHYPTMPNNYQRLDRPKAIYPVQMSVKLFLFVMTFLSLTGYFLRAPYIYVLFNYDFALNYSDKISMAIADGIYIFAIIIYLPLQLFYLCFYMKEHGFFENWENGTIIKIIFSITLLSNFWQKWLFESLVAHEKLCEKRLESNSTLTCWGHREYHSNHSNMSEAQSEAYHSMEMNSPLSYSCTMELLIVYLVVLCFGKAKKIKQKRWRASLNNDRNFVVNKYLAGIVGILMCLMPLTATIGLSFKIITLYHDKKNSMEEQIHIRNILKFAWILLELVVFGFLIYIYQEFDIKFTVLRQENRWYNFIVRAVNENKIVKWLSLRVFLFQTNEPDLIILQLTWWVGIFGYGIRFVLHVINIWNGNFVHKHWIFSLIPSAMGYISSGMNLILLHKFLTQKTNLKPLYKNKFTKFVIPYQIIRCFLRAIYYYVLNLKPNVPLAADQRSIWALIYNAAYPFAPLMYITSALCWSHVLGKFISNGSYNFSTAINDDDYTSVDSNESQSSRDQNFSGPIQIYYIFSIVLIYQNK